MSLIVNETEIENLIVVKRATGESVEVEAFQDQNGNIIWELNKNSDVIIGITVLDVTVAPRIVLGVYKFDDAPNTIDWGDGTVEQLTTATNSTSYEYGSVPHIYAQNGDYDIKISGKGLIKLGTYGTANSGNRAGIFNWTKEDGSATESWADVYIVPRYYKIGTVCKALASPFGLSLSDPVFPHNYQHPVCCFYNLSPSPYVFSIGEGVSQCFYNSSLTFEAMKNQMNKVFYNNPQTKNDFMGGFEGDGYSLLTGAGSAFDHKNLKNYPFTGVGYLDIRAGVEIFEFPETLTSFCKSCFNWLGTATLKFLTPSGVKVDMPEKFTNSKTAYNITIYTDNETIKNYDWAGANLTATIYHLDGTAWA